MGRKPKKNEKPQVNEELKGFDIQVNEFGEITSTFDIQKLNNFLDKKVDDKKFRGIEVVKRVNEAPENQDSSEEEDANLPEDLPLTDEEDAH